MTEEKFEEDKFMKILVNLKETQESIQGFSGWCIRNKKSAFHAKIQQYCGPNGPTASIFYGI